MNAALITSGAACIIIHMSGTPVRNAVGTTTVADLGKSFVSQMTS